MVTKMLIKCLFVCGFPKLKILQKAKTIEDLPIGVSVFLIQKVTVIFILIYTVLKKLLGAKVNSQVSLVQMMKHYFSVFT